VESTALEQAVPLVESRRPHPLSQLGAGPGPGRQVTAEHSIEVAIDPDDVAFILQSSGSTGSPKRVLVSHRNVNAVVLATSTGIPVRAGEKVLALPPFHHAFGLLMVVQASLYQGATLVTMSRFDPERFLSTVANEKISRLYIVPTIAALLADSPLVDRYDLGSVHSMVSGGAPLDAEIARRVRERLGCGLAQGYGMTEAMMSFMQRDFWSTSKSVGTSSTNVSWRVIDPDSGAELGAGEVGEVCIGGPHVSSGYLGDEEATASSFDEKGFLRTGDLGYRDEGDELVLVDRLKEIIKYKGHQVAPAELEELLRQHPSVTEAAVIGVPDTDAGELPRAYVVPAGTLDEGEVLEYVNARVAPYKRLRQCEVVQELPHTAVGKIDRQELKKALIHDSP
jgi:acyl-CoA synthetase (AMP-forming)/AMP-acid ligase II